MNARGQKRRSPVEQEIITVEHNDENSESDDFVNAPKRIKITIPRILDGTFFTIEKNINGSVEARCVECRKIIKGCLTSTGNFKKHITKIHNESLNKLTDHLRTKSDAACSYPKVQTSINTFFRQTPEQVNNSDTLLFVEN